MPLVRVILAVLLMSVGNDECMGHHDERQRQMVSFAAKKKAVSQSYRACSVHACFSRPMVGVPMQECTTFLPLAFRLPLC